MFAFELTNAVATLDNFNPRVEKAGPDKIPAADLKFSSGLGAEILAHFSPSLRALLFDESAPKDLADGMQLRDRHCVYPMRRDEEMTGATVTIEYGVGKPMVFQECKVNQFALEPKEGGTVVVGFRVQCRPDEKQAAKLFMLQETGVTLTVAPPELNTMQDAA